MFKKVLDWTAFVLLVVGGLNWGLMSVDYNLVTGVFGTVPFLVTVVYVLVGLSALYVLFDRFNKKG